MAEAQGAFSHPLQDGGHSLGTFFTELFIPDSSCACLSPLSLGPIQGSWQMPLPSWGRASGRRVPEVWHASWLLSQSLSPGCLALCPTRGRGSVRPTKARACQPHLSSWLSPPHTQVKGECLLQPRLEVIFLAFSSWLSLEEAQHPMSFTPSGSSHLWKEQKSAWRGIRSLGWNLSGETGLE